MRVIKKYRNRKLYDTGSHAYTTLKEVLTLLKQGEKVKVLSFTGQDVTETTILQSIYQHSLVNKKFRKSVINHVKGSM